MSQRPQPSQPRRLFPSKPSRPEPPPDRLAEIQAEIRCVHEPIERHRHATRRGRNAADLTALEPQVARLTDPLARSPVGEALQQTVDDPQTHPHARPLIQRAGTTIKDQGKRPVTARTMRGPVVLRAP